MQTEPRAPLSELLTSARGGDEDAYADLVQAHRVEILAHCYRMLASFPDAEDALQETLLARLEGTAALRGAQLVQVVALPDRHERLPEG